MTTASEAYAVLRAKLEASVPTDTWNEATSPIALRFHGGNDGPLPDDPVPFGFTLFDASPSQFLEKGGGRGSNRHRNFGVMEFFAFVPKLSGQARRTAIAEQVKALFLPMNESGVTVENATVYPGGPGSELSVPGMNANEVGNYDWAACSVEFYCDQIG